MSRILSRALGFLAGDLAIDLGTANTSIFVKGRGIVLSEPTVVAIKLDSSGNKRIKAVGGEAKEMIGRTPGNIRTVRPMKDGVIADYEVAEAMLKSFIARTGKGRGLLKPRMVVCVPTGITEVEKRAVKEAVHAAGAREVYLIEEPMAAAIGVDLPIAEPTSNMIVDVGAGTTEIAVISLAGIVYSRSIRVGGDKMDEAILQHVKRRHNLLIGVARAETLKVELASAWGDAAGGMEIRGRDLVTGIPKNVMISTSEIRQAVSEQVETIVHAVMGALEQTPPELASDIIERGIVLTGGVAQLRGLDELLRERTRLPVTVAENPCQQAAIGSGKVLESLDVLRQVSVS